jgi:Aromatic acid exporter family member 1
LVSWGRLVPRSIRGAVQAAPDTLILVPRRAQPGAVFVARLTATAVFAYLLALQLPGASRPVLAPLTALLVVQVTMYQTMRSALQRVVSVMAGVLVAVLFTDLVGFSWWSLGSVIAASLAIGYLLRLGEHTLEVPISGMLILAVGTRPAATGRIVETLVGAGAGLVGGLIFAPLRVQPAEDAIGDLSRQLAEVLERMANDLSVALDPAAAAGWLSQARALSGEIQRVDRALAEAEDSLRLNPRGRLLSRAITFALRDGLATLERAAITIRGLVRSVADAADAGVEVMAKPEVRERFASVLLQLAATIRDFGDLVRADIVTGGRAAETRQRAEAALTSRLSEASQHLGSLAESLRAEPPAGDADWPLRGEMLTHLRRLRDELQVENRARARERWPRRDARHRQLPRRLRRPRLHTRRPPR